MTDALDRVMLSLPTGHYVNTYAPLEKKAAISAQPVGRERLLLWRAQWRVQSPAEDDRGRCLDMALHRQNHSVLL